MPHATLHSTGHDTWEGALQDHNEDVLVHVRQAAPASYQIMLWGLVDSGRNPIGSGRLVREGARLIGSCDEVGPRRDTVWTVTGDVGFARLEFGK